MSEFNSSHYFVITGWMVSELQLKGSELMVYAIIYGYSQDGESMFSGSADYLAKWTNTTRRNVMNCLSSLVEKDFVLKQETYKNGVKFVSYMANPQYTPYGVNFTPYEKNSQGGVKNFHRGYEKSSHNNLEDNIADNLVKEKEKEKESGIPYTEIVDYLNMRTGSHYRAASQKTKDLIKARYNEGYTIEDFKTVIDKKTAQWIDDPKMSEFLRPETLFSNKFEGYLNQQVSKKQKTLKDVELSLDDDYWDFMED